MLGAYFGLLVVPVATAVTGLALLAGRRSAIVPSLLAVFAVDWLGFVVVLAR